MGLWFVIVDFWVPSVLCRVLDNIEISNVDGVLHGVRGVGVEKILKKRVGDRVTLGGGVQAEAFKGLVVQVNLNAGCSAWM